MPIQILNSINMNYTNIMHSVGIFKESTGVNSISSSECQDEQCFIIVG